MKYFNFEINYPYLKRIIKIVLAVVVVLIIIGLGIKYYMSYTYSKYEYKVTGTERTSNIEITVFDLSSALSKKIGIESQSACRFNNMVVDKQDNIHLVDSFTGSFITVNKIGAVDVRIPDKEFNADGYLLLNNLNENSFFINRSDMKLGTVSLALKNMKSMAIIDPPYGFNKGSMQEMFKLFGFYRFAHGGSLWFTTGKPGLPIGVIASNGVTNFINTGIGIDDYVDNFVIIDNNLWCVVRNRFVCLNTQKDPIIIENVDLVDRSLKLKFTVMGPEDGLLWSMLEDAAGRWSFVLLDPKTKSVTQAPFQKDVNEYGYHPVWLMTSASYMWFMFTVNKTESSTFPELRFSRFAPGGNYETHALPSWLSDDLAFGSDSEDRLIILDKKNNKLCRLERFTGSGR